MGKREAVSLQLPLWCPKELWAEYVTMRRTIRKPLTPFGEKLMLDDLIDLVAQGHDPAAVLKNSIKNSYQGLFAPKEAAKPQIVRAETRVGASPRPQDFGTFVKPEVLERIRKREAERKKAG